MSPLFLPVILAAPSLVTSLQLLQFDLHCWTVHSSSYLKVNLNSKLSIKSSPMLAYTSSVVQFEIPVFLLCEVKVELFLC
jgi:hypothetical protein